MRRCVCQPLLQPAVQATFTHEGLAAVVGQERVALLATAQCTRWSSGLAELARQQGCRVLRAWLFRSTGANAVRCFAYPRQRCIKHRCDPCASIEHNTNAVRIYNTTRKVSSAADTLQTQRRRSNEKNVNDVLPAVHAQRARHAPRLARRGEPAATARRQLRRQPQRHARSQHLAAGARHREVVAAQVW